MKRSIFIISVSVLMVAAPSYLMGWGRTGHDVVAAIAERHLTDKAKAEIKEILDGKSIIYYTKWMDEVRNTPEYRHTTNWHVSHVDADFTPVIAETHGKYKGDALWGLNNYVLPVLEDYKSYDDSTRATNLKFLIHLIGDMHCPAHIYYNDYRNFYVSIDGKRVSHHKLWDENLIDLVHGWSYSEYADMLDTMDEKEIKEICKGKPEEWVKESAERCRIIYTWIEPELEKNEISQDYKNKAIKLAEYQLVIAGYRLASVLNVLFGK